jgi:hypothetical protein
MTKVKENTEDKHPLARAIQERGTSRLRLMSTVTNVALGITSGFISAYHHHPNWDLDTGVMLADATVSSLDDYLKAFCKDFKVPDDFFNQMYSRMEASIPVTESQLREAMESPGRNLVQSIVSESLGSAGKFFAGYGIGCLAGWGIRAFYKH